VDKAGAYSVNEIYNFNRNDDEIDFHQTSIQNTSLNFSDSRERNGNLYQQRGKSRSDMRPSDRLNGATRAAIEKST
jgi:hypothetical protein